jgi:UDPglucose--hexose-1-phosphate uridylyltransferase
MENARPHRRWNPLKREWIMVSPHRAMRPWSGAVEKVESEKLPPYDPGCYLCPRNTRANGISNPDYSGTYAFDNDFPALLREPSSDRSELNDIIVTEGVTGICRVICFSPRHDLTIARMSTEEISGIIQLWQVETEQLAGNPDIQHIMVFENKGSMMGCSNPHPHGQIWATSNIPTLPHRMLEAQKEYQAARGQPLLLDYHNWELEQKERIVCANDHWTALVPFWAAWPFEVMILPRRAVADTRLLSNEETIAWADILRRMTSRFDNLFKTSFPYSMGVYQAPIRGEWPGHCLHQLFMPPLLRSATIRKFMVGFELCAEAQRDITPEQAAGRLRECAENFDW